MTDFQKLSISLRYFLIGKEFNTSLMVWDFAEKFHDGLRKDLITKEFQHQIEIALFIRTLPHVPCLDTTLSVALLHDTSEDKDVAFEEIESKFGKIISRHVRTLSKVYRGVKTPTDIYYENISKDPLTAIVKGADRLHNVSTMVGVFTKEKMLDYVKETETYVIPMLKNARRSFPKYETTFENMKHNLKQQLKLIEMIASIP